MTAIRNKHGNAGLAAAYFALGERYFDQSVAIDGDLVAKVLDAVATLGAVPQFAQLQRPRTR